MSENKKRNWKRVLGLSVQPRQGVTTVNRTFLIDVCVGDDGKPFFLLNSDFAKMQPRDIARVVKSISDKKTYNNVFVHDDCSFAPFKKEGGANTPKKADADDGLDDVDFDDDDSEGGDDF